MLGDGRGKLKRREEAGGQGQEGRRGPAPGSGPGSVWQGSSLGLRVGKSGTGCQGLGPARLAATGFGTNTDSHLRFYLGHKLTTTYLPGYRATVITITTSTALCSHH